MVHSGVPLEGFDACPVLGILRGVTPGCLIPALEAAAGAGLGFAEITLNTQDAPRLIEQGAKTFAGRLTLGAGTVLSLEDARTAVTAGASFLVSPTLNEEVAGYCRQNALPYIPGALTPTEIEKAWKSGAALIKVFPASRMGPGYFREVAGPFPGTQLMAVGGVHAGNATEYLNSGAAGLAVGGSIFSQERMAAGDFAAIQKDLSEILLAVRGFLSKIPS